jgi:hypothetical protein
MPPDDTSPGTTPRRPCPNGSGYFRDHYGYAYAVTSPELLGTSMTAPLADRPPLARITTRALLVPCGFCWAEPATPCTDVGQHYARFLRMYRRGILGTPGLAAVSKAVPHISAGAIVPNAFDAETPQPR